MINKDEIKLVRQELMDVFVDIDRLEGALPIAGVLSEEEFHRQVVGRLEELLASAKRISSTGPGRAF